MLKKIVMPGDHVAEAEEMVKTRKVILGPGLRRTENDEVIVTKAGTLCLKEPNTFFVDTYQRRYTPIRGEGVIGVVTQKQGEAYRVDIGAHEQATISYLSFESATKKNRPDINVGDLIYGRLVVACKEFESEMVCVNSQGKKGKYGVLADGFVFNCSLNLARKVLQEDGHLRKELARMMPYELVVGLNGRIWIKANTTIETIAIGSAILMSEYTSNEEISKICENIGSLIY